VALLCAAGLSLAGNWLNLTCLRDDSFDHKEIPLWFSVKFALDLRAVVGESLVCEYFTWAILPAFVSADYDV
jgi:hypothetical protein